MNFTFPAMYRPPGQRPPEDDLAHAFPRIMAHPRFSATPASSQKPRVGPGFRELHTNRALFAPDGSSSGYL